MSRAVVAAALVTIIISSLYGEKKGWDHYVAFTLTKDRWQSVEIHEGEKVHTLKFCWTLYKNGALVMHVNYDNYRYQPLLYAKYRLDSFKVEIFPKSDDSSRSQLQTPYALIMFKAFDEKKREAYLDLGIKDYGMSEIFYAEGKK
ncbi:MAG: hypothetical protein L3J42_02085 [Hydrogenimonas sp.]|nr:hypothetical protein [Hydrogenimonas sp.]